MGGYLALLGSKGGPLSTCDDKVPDGIRYHVLDVWIDGLEGIMNEESERPPPLQRFLLPVEELGSHGRTKALCRRAKDVRNDVRVRRWLDEDAEDNDGNRVEDDEAQTADEWDGFAD